MEADKANGHKYLPSVRTRLQNRICTSPVDAPTARYQNARGPCAQRSKQAFRVCTDLSVVSFLHGNAEYLEVSMCNLNLSLNTSTALSQHHPAISHTDVLLCLRKHLHRCPRSIRDLSEVSRFHRASQSHARHSLLINTRLRLKASGTHCSASACILMPAMSSSVIWLFCLLVSPANDALETVKSASAGAAYVTHS